MVLSRRAGSFGLHGGRGMSVRRFWISVIVAGAVSVVLFAALQCWGTDGDVAVMLIIGPFRLVSPIFDMVGPPVWLANTSDLAGIFAYYWVLTAILLSLREKHLHGRMLAVVVLGVVVNGFCYYLGELLFPWG